VSGHPAGAGRAAAQPNPAGDPDGLVAAAIGGDTAALERLLAVVRPLAWRYARARLGPGARPSGVGATGELAREICLAVTRALPHYRDSGRSFLGFVYGIAAREVAHADPEAGRAPERPGETVPDPDAATPGARSQGAPVAGDRAELDGLTAVLPEYQREVLVLRVAVGFSAAETAAALGSTPGAVRVVGHRALARLRVERARRAAGGA
jgi:RNA polymerase sigma-70 factor (ECF subfamily)